MIAVFGGLHILFDVDTNVIKLTHAISKNQNEALSIPIIALDRNTHGKLLLELLGHIARSPHPVWMTLCSRRLYIGTYKDICIHIDENSGITHTHNTHIRYILYIYIYMIWRTKASGRGYHLLLWYAVVANQLTNNTLYSRAANVVDPSNNDSHPDHQAFIQNAMKMNKSVANIN